jgi:hypothetical protein
MARGQGPTRQSASGTRCRHIVGATPLDYSDLVRLCAEYEVDVAPSLAANCFYHVAASDDRDAIAREGLRPGAATGRRNFAEYPRHDGCVYLWPCVGTAQTYIDLDTQTLGKNAHLLLEVSALDLSLLRPDQEELARLLEEPDCFPAGEAIVALLKADGFELTPTRERSESFAAALELIATLDPETILLAVNALALSGNALMVETDAIAPSTLAVMELNEWEALNDQFSEAHPELDPWKGDEFDESLEEARDEAFELWASGRRIIERDALTELLQNGPEELVANDEVVYYSATPLVSVAA